MLRTVQTEVEVTGSPSIFSAAWMAESDCIWTQAESTTASALAIFRR